MIDFICKNCGKQFSIAKEFAGRKGKCKQCGITVTVPASPARDSNKIVIEIPTVSQPTRPSAITSPQHVLSSETGKARNSVRSRRLQADQDQVKSAFDQSSLIRVKSVVGNPPEAYHIEYNVKGLVRGDNGNLVVRKQHIVEIRLTRDYPRQSPVCRMLTPIFHPNIEPAMICVGDHWTAGERLVDLIVRIGEMITYQAYNIKSPLDGEAAMWAETNRVHLPIDKSHLQPSNLS